MMPDRNYILSYAACSRYISAHTLDRRQRAGRGCIAVEDGKICVCDVAARAHWSTDRAGDPKSVSNRILKALVDSGENGLTSAEAAAIINKK